MEFQGRPGISCPFVFQRHTDRRRAFHFPLSRQTWGTRGSRAKCLVGHSQGEARIAVGNQPTRTHFPVWTWLQVGAWVGGQLCHRFLGPHLLLSHPDNYMGPEQVPPQREGAGQTRRGAAPAPILTPALCLSWTSSAVSNFLWPLVILG